MPKFNYKIIITVFFLVLLVTGGGYFAWKDFKKESGKSPGEIGSLPQNPAPPPPAPPPSPTPSRPIPALPFPVEVKANLSAENEKKALDKIQELTLRLRENPDLESYWIELGLYRKLIGDLDGAREAWEYAAYIRPGDFIPLSNLGDLYAYSLNNPKKAEEYFLKAIEAEPSVVMIYEKLYEVYRFLLKDDKKAREILEEGIRKNPSTSERLAEILKSWN